MKILIVGAGISGLTASALLSEEHEVTVLEKAPMLRLSGAGLTLWNNAVNVLQNHLNLKAGSEIDALRIISTTDEILTSINVSDGFCAPLVSVSRAELIKKLYDKTSTRVIFGEEVLAFSQDASQATVTTNAQDWHADIVIAADGYKSLFRTTLYGNKSLPQPTGWRAIQGIAHNYTLNADEHISSLYPAEKVLSIITPLRNNKTHWSFDIHHSLCHDNPLKTVENIKQNVRLHHKAEKALELISENSFVAQHTRSKPVRSLKHRVLLIGDSLRTHTPPMAQGATQSILDAYALTQVLNSHSDYSEKLEADLAHYSRTRLLKSYPTYAASIVDPMLHSNLVKTGKYLPPSLLNSGARGWVKLLS